MLKDGSKVVVESSGRLLWEVVVENLQSTLVEVPNSGGWGVGEERALNRSPKYV